MRWLLLVLLIGCVEEEDPVPPEPTATMSVTITRSGGTTSFSGCWHDTFGCLDGAAPMQVTWRDHHLEAPYKASWVGGTYDASSPDLVAGDEVTIEFDGATASIVMPADNTLALANDEVRANSLLAVDWLPSDVPVTLHASWICDHGSGQSASSSLLAAQDPDLGHADVDVLGTQPAYTAGEPCTVELFVRSKRTVSVPRMLLVAQQTQRQPLVFATPAVLPRPARATRGDR